jgi:hypothetical protein
LCITAILARYVGSGSKAAFSLPDACQLPPAADIPISSAHRRACQVRASHTSSPSSSNTAKPAVSFRASWPEWLGASRDADVCDPERVWLQPRYRGLAHTIGSRQISLRNALHKPLDNFLALMDGKHRRPAKTHPTSFSAGCAVAAVLEGLLPLGAPPPRDCSAVHPAPRRSAYQPDNQSMPFAAQPAVSIV